jgi:uncharacterized protein (DUF362 family)
MVKTIIHTDRERREFLKKLSAAGFAVGLGGALPLFDATGARAEAAPSPKPLAAVKGDDPALMVREAVGKLGAMSKFVKPGFTVVIKPNIGWDRTPEEGANTHPAIVAELAKMALEAGAEKVQIFDRTCNDSRRCYKRSGVEDAIEALSKEIDDDRVTLSFVDDIRFETVEIKGAKSLTKWPLYRPALAADALINVPVLKHHGLTGVTIGMKNLMGVMGGNRGRIHKKIEDSLVDLNMAVRSTLTVVDATRVLTKGGPQGGGTKNVRIENRLAACEDVVTADAWGAKVFGVDPMEVAHIRRAVERGLGIADLEKVTII